MVQHHLTQEERFEIAMKHLSLVLIAHFPLAASARASLPKRLRRDIGLSEDCTPRRWFDY
jgi:hypothetical protein